MPILGLGNDICHIPRIYRILTSCHAHRFIARVLTAEERSEPRPQALLRCIGSRPSRSDQSDAPWATGASDNRIPNVWKAAVFMAGRFAAKEAAIKAHSSRRLTFEDIRIVRTRPAARPLKGADDEKDREEETGHDDGTNDAALSSGPPVAVIKGYPPGQPDTTAMLSISHDGDYAAAVCLSVQGT
ncbi:holo-acyl-carrier-protein synthase [Apiospora aurea]|uniref:Holo-acyl-carrier-protein synthase n=1 Tax=Apiospora aurea TaxID=335848 RepID=A0ABR1QIQ0_9PEZI